MAVEYLSKEEIVGVLNGLKHERLIAQDNTGAETVDIALDRINKLYSVRPVLTATWKIMGERKDFIFCSRCGFKTLVYKRTAYCPNCGRKMLNGRAIDDQG